MKDPKPKWWLLYAVVPLALLLLIAADLTSPSGGWRKFAEGMASLGIMGAMALWVRANRVALTLLGGTREAGEPFRAWVAYSPPPVPRRKLEMVEIEPVHRLVVHADHPEEESLTCCAN
jgi:hypothetical protein